VAVEKLSLVRRGSQLYRRNRQKSHALHSRSAGNYVPVPTYFSGNSEFQCSVPCQHVQQFPNPHRNHSGHTLRPWEWSTGAIIIITTTNANVIKLTKTMSKLLHMCVFFSYSTEKEASTSMSTSFNNLTSLVDCWVYDVRYYHCTMTCSSCVLSFLSL